jgi:hypothetical protein
VGTGLSAFAPQSHVTGPTAAAVGVAGWLVAPGWHATSSASEPASRHAAPAVRARLLMRPMLSLPLQSVIWQRQYSPARQDEQSLMPRIWGLTGLI